MKKACGSVLAGRGLSSAVVESSSGSSSDPGMDSYSGTCPDMLSNAGSDSGTESLPFRLLVPSVASSEEANDSLPIPSGSDLILGRTYVQASDSV